jgi:hypothetical protein
MDLWDSNPGISYVRGGSDEEIYVGLYGVVPLCINVCMQHYPV